MLLGKSDREAEERSSQAARLRFRRLSMARKPLGKIDGPTIPADSAHKVIAISVPRRQDMLLSRLIAQLRQRGCPNVSRSRLIQMLIANGLEGHSFEEIVRTLGPTLWESRMPARRNRARKVGLDAEQIELPWGR
jgi:hypothetical protein